MTDVSILEHSVAVFECKIQQARFLKHRVHDIFVLLYQIVPTEAKHLVQTISWNNEIQCLI